MGSKKCKIIQPVETKTEWEVECPYCQEYVYIWVDDETDLIRCDCDNCGARFIVNMKEYFKNINNERNKI